MNNYSIYQPAVKPLSEEQIAQYFCEGYLVASGLVPPEAVEKVLAPIKTIEPSGNRWTPKIFLHEKPTLDAEFHQLLIEPRIVGAAEQIFELPARVYYGMVAVVPAGGGHGLPWHQDNQYHQILGGALNMFVALCDITPDKAILWVAPKSHLGGVQPSKQNETTAIGHREALVEPENGVPLPAMKTGDVCIFDRSFYHRSLQNHTNEHRYAYAAQYQADNARLADNGEKDARKMRVSELQEIWNNSES